ncbi:MAG: hypothetical protein JO314_02235 [Acidobacteria bacterium]|nr:hypothetical protein [Acidobacteriota bacterium]
MIKYTFSWACAAAIVAVCVCVTCGQRTAPANPMIFAVVQNGTSLEPIASIDKGRLKNPVNGSDDANALAAFSRAYYKKGAAYKLVFGSANAGTVTVSSANLKSECGKNIATVTTHATKTPLKGLVMGLATNAGIRSTAASYRRKPTTAEKDEIDALVKAEFVRQKLSPKTLHYQNLTALDVDNDGKADLVGSYWTEVDKMTRGLLFFIATKGSNGKYSFSYKEYRSVDQANVMSGDIKAVDGGVYHELLLDAFDYDGDGVAEIFTYQQGFEGSGFFVYAKKGGKWTREYEFNNYHCAF